MTIAVRPAELGEWARFRDLRLEMLTDSPHAYLTPLATAEGYSDAEWRTRHTSQLMPDSMVIAGVDAARRWVGMMAAREYLSPQPRVWLLSVYVTPAHRSSDLAERLLRQVEAWTRGRGYRELYLDVHERAAAARRFYTREGFVETGRTQRYELNPTEWEHEMVKQLTPCASPDGRA